MKIGLSNMPQIRAVDGGGWIAQQLTAMVAQISTSFGKEHNDNDTHSTINATGTISERSRTVPMGEWILIPFVSTNFTASGSMTWTVLSANVAALKYTLIGKTCFVLFNITMSSVSGTMSTGLRIALPSTLVAKDSTVNSIRVFDNAAWVSGVVITNCPTATATTLTLSREDNANFTASSSNTSVQGLAVFEIR